MKYVVHRLSLHECGVEVDAAGPEDAVASVRWAGGPWRASHIAYVGRDALGRQVWTVLLEMPGTHIREWARVTEAQPG